MQDMDILDMNILDDTENNNGIPAMEDDDDTENFHCGDDELLNEEHDFMQEDEAGDPEVRSYATGLSVLSCLSYNTYLTGKFLPIYWPLQMDDMETLDKDEYMTCSSINMVCLLTFHLVCKTLKEEQKTSGGTRLKKNLINNLI